MECSKLLHNAYDKFRHIGFTICPKTTLKFEFYRHLGYVLNLKNPKTFNEKIQWLKLYDRNPNYTRMVDKYEVRKYISETIGEEYLIPAYGVWDSFDDIDFNKLPEQFVLKCTHDSGGIVICTDKSQMDFKAAGKKVNNRLKRNYYYSTLEYPYKNVKPRIIAEKYMVDESGTELKDYKFLCFNGIPKFLIVMSERNMDTKSDYFDIRFNPIPNIYNDKNSIKKISKPDGYEEMLSLSTKLSKNIPHVRVDLYNINGRVYFGELTFYQSSGFERFRLQEYDELLGSWIKLPKV